MLPNQPASTSKFRAQNIPIEVLRTIVAIADTGSFSQAANRLCISQPAVTAQIKRLESIVAADIFERVANGSSPTCLGVILIALARKTLDAHDQILSLRSPRGNSSKIRFGISPLLTSHCICSGRLDFGSNEVAIVTDQSAALGKLILESQLDLACCLFFGNVDAQLRPYVVAEAVDELVWVKSPSLALHPGRPIPIVTWHKDDWITAALFKSGLEYDIVFDGENFDAKRSFVENGRGVGVLPSRLVPKQLQCASEDYLPKLSTVTTVVLSRILMRSPPVDDLIEQIKRLLALETV